MNTPIVAVLQTAQAGAANGSTANVAGMDELGFEVSGTYTGITANFEMSIDAGVSWNPLRVTIPAGTSALVATANGLYAAPLDMPFGMVRARTTVSTPTGSMTVKSFAREQG